MSKIAFLFPGQGSQAVGMGAALVDKFPEVRAAFDSAQVVLGWDLREACRQGPDDRLRQTDVAQPALYVTGYAAYLALKGLGITPDGAAGHSIGEYAALAAAGVFSFEEGLALVRERGKLMQTAAQAHPGGMAAILGLDAATLAAVCKEVSGQGVCVPVNFNSPEQIVIAGDAAAVKAAGELASARGAKRVIPLNVSGAFHSPLMAEAARAMRAHLSKVVFKQPAIPVVMNADGELVRQAAEVETRLALQLDHAVQWVKSIETFKQNGFSRFVECGSGKVLSGLLRRIDKGLDAYNTDTADSLAQAAEALQAARKGSH